MKGNYQIFEKFGYRKFKLLSCCLICLKHHNDMLPSTMQLLSGQNMYHNQLKKRILMTCCNDTIHFAMQYQCNTFGG